MRIIKEHNGEGEYATAAAEYLVSLYYDDVRRATGEYCAHLKDSVIENQIKPCMIKAALKCPHSNLAGYFIDTFKNKLYDLSFRIKPEKDKVVKDYEVFKELEKKHVKDIFDHNKIILFKKTKRGVQFSKRDLDVLSDEEKNLLALISQIPCTNEIIAKRMGISKSKVDMMIHSLHRNNKKRHGSKRIECKLLPAYIRNRNKYGHYNLIDNIIDEQDFLYKQTMQTEMIRLSKTSEDNEDVAEFNIQMAKYTGSDNDDDFNVPKADRTVTRRMNLPEKEK